MAIGRGSRRTIYTLSEAGEPQPIQVVVGATNGSQTEVSGRGVRPGLEVITGRLAAEGGESGGTGAGSAGGGRGRNRGG